VLCLPAGARRALVEVPCDQRGSTAIIAIALKLRRPPSGRPARRRPPGGARLTVRGDDLRGAHRLGRQAATGGALGLRDGRGAGPGSPLGVCRRQSRAGGASAGGNVSPTRRAGAPRVRDRARAGPDLPQGYVGGRAGPTGAASGGNAPPTSARPRQRSSCRAADAYQRAVSGLPRPAQCQSAGCQGARREKAH